MSRFPRLPVVSRFAACRFLASLVFVGALPFTMTPALRAQTPATTFGPNGPAGAVLLQPDGKLVVAGAFTQFNGQNTPPLVRLNTDGTRDDAFSPNATFPAGARLLLKANGKFLYYGASAAVPNAANLNLARLNANGSFDRNFNLPADLGNDSVGLASTQPGDGKTLAVLYGGSGGYRLVRLLNDGSLDPNFQTVRVFYTDAASSAAQPVLALAVQADGKILLGGGFTQVNGAAAAGIARLNADGTLDAAYQVALTPPASLPTVGGVDSIFLLPDGRAVIGGTFDAVNGATRRNLARLNADGTLDAGFTADAAIAGASPTPLGVTPEGKVILQLRVVSFAGQPLVRLNADGTRDAGFNAILTSAANPRNPAVYDIAAQADGKLFVVGNFTGVNGVPRNSVARLNADGGADPSFIPGGGLPALASTVNLVATRAAIAENSAQPGVFVVSRAGGDNSADLTVNYTVRGTAAAGVNYQPLAENSVIIPAGRDTAKIKVRPFADGQRTGNLTVRVTLSAPTQGGYNLGSSTQAKVTILDVD